VKKIAREEPSTYRQRVFFRNDIKKRLANIFMCHSDQVNCTFEPNAASLKPKVKYNGKTVMEVEKINAAVVDHNSYSEKMGPDFIKAHPEVFKAGKLKKANFHFRNGDFERSMNALGEGFNIDSLNRRFNPKYLKQQMVKTMMEKMKAKRTTSEETKGKAMGASIAHLREKVEDTQKKMV
jgi:hypothetical protein